MKNRQQPPRREGWAKNFKFIDRADGLLEDVYLQLRDDCLSIEELVSPLRDSAAAADRAAAAEAVLFRFFSMCEVPSLEEISEQLNDRNGAVSIGRMIEDLYGQPDLLGQVLPYTFLVTNRMAALGGETYYMENTVSNILYTLNDAFKVSRTGDFKIICGQVCRQLLTCEPMVAQQAFRSILNPDRYIARPWEFKCLRAQGAELLEEAQRRIKKLNAELREAQGSVDSSPAESVRDKQRKLKKLIGIAEEATKIVMWSADRSGATNRSQW